ncbi:oligopeptide transport system permease [Streptococcus pyogenes]|uniref:ABC transporter permease n=1 Tax=Streptococcus pyogenes TaxID=1314 RepID=UPI0010A1AAB2|nr:ABC transporter permease [Streptococcus pyogenes]VGS12317.1 oligopeptide transport system permease [Streptococcus pyogenes]VGS14744.1 oligopeptide transport system permease [Streptococcus pyogenes]
MKKYILNRIMRSLVSVVLVTALTYTIVYTLVPTSLIFKQDPNYNKMTTTPDKKVAYENLTFQRMGYVNYFSSKELKDNASKVDSSVTTEATSANKAIYEKYIDSLGNGWQLKRFPTSKQFYAIRNIPIYERVWNFFSNLVVIDHPWNIQDKDNPKLARYIRLEKDKSVGWSLVGSGTKHKYLLYTNGKFPYLHQNFVTLNLGTSYPTYSNIPVLQVISQGQGRTALQDVTFPSGVTKKSSVDIYSRSYKNPKSLDDITKVNYGKGDSYTKTINNYVDPSMIHNSFVIGFFGVMFSYIVGLPLGLFMARFKNTYFDRFSTATMTFMLALPSIAVIYVVRFLGGMVGLPDSFPMLGASDPKSYILPALILGILNIPTTVIWFRRYLVDLQASDWVRFARSKGLSESEIYRGHLFKNAMVPIVSGVPASIILAIGGATLTETVFAFPGMGKMLIDSIKSANNSMIVGLTFIFTVLSIVSLLLGDIVMTLVDPRIKLSTKKGGK